MATALHNILRFTGLTIGVPVALPHRLNANGLAVVPRLICADGAGYTITADTVNVTVTRGATAGADVSVYVEYWHTIENAQPLPGGIATSLFPFVVQGGGSGGGGGGIQTISGGTTNATGPGVSFANGNNITFGIVGNTITASVQTAGGTATGVGISAGTESAGTGAVVFSNANNISFGMNASTVTASFSASIQPNPAISAAGASASNGTIVFSNSNNVSFGMAGSTVTASAPAETPFGISAGTQSISTGTLVFSNSNGVTFGMSGSSRITASVSSVVFSNSNNVTFGLNGSTLTATASFAAGDAIGAIAANADGSATSGTVVFSNSNNISFGINGNTITATVAGGGETPFGISAGTQSVSTGTMVFSNSNGLAFGMSGSSRITGSYSTLSFSNLNGVSFGIVGSTITASIAATSDSGVAIAAVGSTRSTGTVLFTTHASLGNNVSFFYTNGSQIVANAGIAIGAPAGGTGGNFQQIDFNDGNGVSFGRAGFVVTASVAAGGGVAISADGGLISTGTASFRNSNGVLWTRNGQTIDVLRVNTVSGANGESVRMLASGAAMVISNANSNISMLGGGEISISAASHAILRAGGAGFAILTGPAAQVSGGEITISANTGLQMTAGGPVTVAAGSAMGISAGNAMSVTAGGNFAAIASGNFNMTGTSGAALSAGANASLLAGLNVHLNAGSHISLLAASHISLSAASTAIMSAAGQLSLRGAPVSIVGNSANLSGTAANVFANGNMTLSGGSTVSLLGSVVAVNALADLVLGGGPISVLQNAGAALVLGGVSSRSVGFFSSNGATKQVINGNSTNLSAALGSIVSSLLSALHQYGLISSNFT